MNDDKLCWSFLSSSPESLDISPQQPIPVALPEPPTGANSNVYDGLGEGRRSENEPQRSDGDRCFRQMMRERRRRERESQSYADLLAMLELKPKAHKVSIVQSSAMFLKQLKATEAELKRRNEELGARITKTEVRPEGEKNIICKLRVDEPTSSIDSMITALQQLKEIDIKANALRSNLFEKEMVVTFTT